MESLGMLPRIAWFGPCLLLGAVAFADHDLTEILGNAGGLVPVKALTDRFTAQIDCETTCRSEAKPVLRRLTRTYAAPARGLRRGNGDFWGSLASDVDAWGREWCLDAAVDRCGDLKSVAEARVSEMRSGEWKVKGPIDCSARRFLLRSPFSKKAGAQHDVATPPSQAGASTRTALKGTPLGKDKTCAVPISAHLCAGDCMVEGIGTEWEETIASPKPNLERTEKVCADSFVKEFRGKGLSKEVLEHFCKEFLFNSTVPAEVGIRSCAATRLTADCTAAIEAIAAP
jgi:hypothetical protein